MKIFRINPIETIKKFLGFKKGGNDGNDGNDGNNKNHENKHEEKIEMLKKHPTPPHLGKELDIDAMVAGGVAIGIIGGIIATRGAAVPIFILMLLSVPKAYGNQKTKEAGTISSKPQDPIIFDLNSDKKLETTDIYNGVYFDHENDGFAEASAWVGNNDGILVVDSNNNDEIDNGTELLTAETIVSFDTNNDGIIDENDTNFTNLKILKGDGTLLTLSEAGITSININTTLTDITDENGNQQFASGTFTRTAGRVQKAIAFAPNKIYKLKKEKLKKIAA